LGSEKAGIKYKIQSQACDQKNNISPDNL